MSQVTEVVSNTSLRLGERVPEDYAGVSCYRLGFTRVAREYCFTALHGCIARQHSLHQGVWACGKALRDAHGRETI